VNKAEFIEVLSGHFDGNKSEAARVLNAVTQTITYQAAAGEKVTITGFGSFEKVQRPARMVRNPRTGETKRAKATAVPRFRAGSELKAYLAGTKKVPKAAKRTAPKRAANSTASTPTPAATRKAASTAAAVKKAPAKTAGATKTAAASKATTARKTATKTTPAKRATKKAAN